MLFSVLVGVLLHSVGGGAEYLDPNTALAGVYTECVFKFDWPCLQRRTLMFVDRLGRAPEYPLFPGIKLVRTSEVESPPVEEMQLPVGDTERMGDLVDEAVVRFFDEHVVRLEVPHWLADTGRSSKHHVDLFFGNRVEESREMNNENPQEPDSSAKGDVNDLEVPSGRMMMCSASKKCKGAKKGAKKAKKGLKKCLMAVCMVMAAKMMVMAPVMMGLMKVVAIKAIIMSTMSLMMSKGMLMKKFMKGKPIMTIMKGWQADPPPSSGWDSSGGGGDMSWQPTGGGGGGSGPYRRSAVRTQQLAYNNFSSAED